MLNFVKRATLVACTFAGLSACQMNPFATETAKAPVAPEIELLSDISLDENSGTSNLLEQDRDGSGFFSDIWNRVRTPVAADEIAALNSPASEGEAARADATVDVASANNGNPFRFLSGLIAQDRQILPSPDNSANEQIVFGELRKNCNASGATLGTKIMSQSGFEIYDSNPGGTGLRPHFITGFSDRCAREFVGALVFFGDVGTHEVIRYSRTRVTLDYSATDNAYEAIKASFCRVGHGEPCGQRLEALGRRVAFVTVYRSFGAGADWAEFLLHNGDVAGISIEGL